MSIMETKCPHCGTKMRRLGGTHQYACESCGSIIHPKERMASDTSSRETRGQFSYQGKNAKGSSGAQRAYGKAQSHGKKTRDKSSYTGHYEGYASQREQEEKPGRPIFVTILWILGWIFCFPLTLLVFILTRKSMKLNTKLALIIFIVIILSQTDLLWKGIGLAQDFFNRHHIDQVEQFFGEVEELPGDLREQIEDLLEGTEEDYFKLNPPREDIPGSKGKKEGNFFQYTSEVFKDFLAEGT